MTAAGLGINISGYCSFGFNISGTSRQCQRYAALQHSTAQSLSSTKSTGRLCVTGNHPAPRGCWRTLTLDPHPHQAWSAWCSLLLSWRAEQGLVSCGQVHAAWSSRPKGAHHPNRKAALLIKGVQQNSAGRASLLPSPLPQRRAHRRTARPLQRPPISPPLSVRAIRWLVMHAQGETAQH